MGISRRLVVMMLGAPLMLIASAPRLHAAEPTKRSVVSRTPPAYPELARRMKVYGTVTVLANISAEGKVLSTKVRDGHPLLGAAAEEAVRRWKFVVAAEATETLVAVEFRLE